DDSTGDEGRQEAEQREPCQRAGICGEHTLPVNPRYRLCVNRPARYPRPAPNAAPAAAPPAVEPVQLRFCPGSIGTGWVLHASCSAQPPATPKKTAPITAPAIR